MSLGGGGIGRADMIVSFVKFGAVKATLLKGVQ
jgi:hypothetical protein